MNKREEFAHLSTLHAKCESEDEDMVIECFLLGRMFDCWMSMEPEDRVWADDYTRALAHPAGSQTNG